MRVEEVDGRGLIREAYRMEGIDAAECRSIFMDWALGLPEGIDSAAAIELVLGAYGSASPGHPMTEILRAGREAPPSPRRRGGRSGRGRSG